MRKIAMTFLALPALLSTSIYAQKTALENFPAGYTPEEVGHRIAYHFVDAKHGFWGGNTKYISYHEVCACSEQIDTSAKYVFKYHTVASYPESQPVYSQYVSLLKEVHINENKAALLE